MAKHDDLGFIAADDKHEDLGFKPLSKDAESEVLPSNNPLDTLEDAARGAVSGATFAFNDELAGVLGAGSEALMGELPDANKSLLERIVASYEKNRDETRALDKAAQERSPNAFTVGNIAGGVAPAVLTGGTSTTTQAPSVIANILKSAGVGAASGAITGVGASENTSIPALAEDAYEGGKMGALFGGLLQGGIETAKGLSKGIKALGKTKTGKDVADAFKLGKEGTDLVSPEGLDVLESQARKTATNLGLGAETVRKGAGEAIGEAEKALTESGKTFNLRKKINQVKKLASELAESEHPDAAKDSSFLNSYVEKLESKGLDLEKVPYSKAKDILETLNDFNGVSANSKLQTNKAVNNLKQISKSLRDEIKTPEILSADQKYAASKQALDILGLDASDFIRDAQTKSIRLDQAGKSKLNGVVRRMARDTDAGANASETLGEALRLMKESNPEIATALEPQIQQASRSLDLARKAQKLGLLNKSTFVGPGTTNLANRAGMTVNAVKNDLVPIASAVKSVGKKISDATPEDIKKVAQSLVSSGSPAAMKLGSSLVDAINKDNVGRNATLFALQQNPTYRQMLKEYFKDEEVK